MSILLQLFIWLPAVAFLLCLFMPKIKERIISGIAIGTTGIQLIGLIVFIVFWIINGAAVLDIKHVVLYQSNEFDFFIDFYFDYITAVYAFVGVFILFLVSIFSKTYLHRDGGYKRYFSTILFFFLGYNIVVFSGNFETLFIGWEVLGFCSFLLISFYRDRYLPVKNSLKVISIYRLGDVCLMLVMWICHHLFHDNITFFQMINTDLIAINFSGNEHLFLLMSVMILIATSAKSALLPFSSWLPRAMEGPTTSSAIFYGSLSIHLGAFLLMRTYPFWGNSFTIKAIIFVVGITTSIVVTTIARVQSSVKTQIAYSSLTQIGLIFAEIALGLNTIALIHFAGNAFLRTYQLLVSPSVLSYRIHDMFKYFKPLGIKKEAGYFRHINNSLYVLGIKEWNLDRLMYRFLWNPFKWLGSKFIVINNKIAVVFLLLVFLLGMTTFFSESELHHYVDAALPVVFSIIGLVLILKSFADRGNAISAWLFVIAGQVFITLSIALHEPIPIHQIVIYFSAILVACIIGFICLKAIKKIDNDIKLDKFHGYSYEAPVVDFIFMVCCLALIGFPFTPTFLGIDLLFSHIHESHWLLVATTSISFIFIEIAILRLYARIFLGQHKKNTHAIAYKSS